MLIVCDDREIPSVVRDVNIKTYKRLTRAQIRITHEVQKARIVKVAVVHSSVSDISALPAKGCETKSTFSVLKPTYGASVFARIVRV